MPLSRVVRLCMIAMCAAGVPTRASAQANTSFTGTGLLTQPVLSMDMAQAIAAGAVEQCRADGFAVSVAVVDAGGLLKTLLRDDGTTPHTIELSRQKAYAALTLHTRWETTLEAMREHGYMLGSPMSNVEGAALLGGGVPIKVGDVAVGAVGVSGARGGDRDEICARAGIAKVQHLLQ